MKAKILRKIRRLAGLSLTQTGHLTLLELEKISTLLNERSKNSSTITRAVVRAVVNSELVKHKLIKGA